MTRTSARRAGNAGSSHHWHDSARASMTVKGTTTDRGYGAAHKRERAKWKPTVERGDAECHAVVCLEDSRAIAPDAAWHLGHTPDRSAYTGPEHERCNTSEGATRGNAARRNTPTLTLREW